jgi:hypothetical protein
MGRILDSSECRVARKSFPVPILARVPYVRQPSYRMLLVRNPVENIQTEGREDWRKLYENIPELLLLLENLEV